MNGSRGFTLVELLVAITVLAIVAVMGWRGLDGIVRSREQLTRQMEATRGIQLTFAQLQSDLEQIADRRLLRERPNLLADNARLVFVRTTQPEHAASQLQVVSYSIRNGVLARRESPPTRDLLQLDALWQAALGDAGESGTVALQTGVESMAMRVWEAGAWKQPNNNAAASQQQQQQPPGCTDPTPGKCPLPMQTVNDGPTGLEISLQLQGQAAVLVKVFLLGAV